MDIKEKQAIWAVERPLFEAEFIHSHLLPFFKFNENTGDYEIKDECLNTDTSEDKGLAYETLNTGWVMWLRAKRDVKAQAVPEENALLGATLDAVQKLGSGEFVLVPREPTEKMLNAARDWSTAKYGKPVGNDGSKGCYQAMIEAQEPAND